MKEKYAPCGSNKRRQPEFLVLQGVDGNGTSQPHNTLILRTI